MTKVSSAVKLDVQVHLLLNEDEAAALDALAGYSMESFLKTFYAQMGESYLRPHEQGLRSLFHSIREQVPSVLREVAECRQFIAEAKAAREKDREKRR